eukprot:78168-Rhodomonas_salina.1
MRRVALSVSVLEEEDRSVKEEGASEKKTKRRRERKEEGERVVSVQREEEEAEHGERAVAAARAALCSSEQPAGILA